MSFYFMVFIARHQICHCFVCFILQVAFLTENVFMQFTSYILHFTSMDFKILVRVWSDIMLFLIQLFPQNSFTSLINLSEDKHLIPTAKTNISWLVIPLEVGCHLLDLSSSFVHWKFKQSPFLSPINLLLCTS